MSDLIKQITSDFQKQIDAFEPEVDVSAQYPEETAKLSELLFGLYETTKYMLYHNKASE